MKKNFINYLLSGSAFFNLPRVLIYIGPLQYLIRGETLDFLFTGVVLTIIFFILYKKWSKKVEGKL